MENTQTKHMKLRYEMKKWLTFKLYAQWPSDWHHIQNDGLGINHSVRTHAQNWYWFVLLGQRIRVQWFRCAILDYRNSEPAGKLIYHEPAVAVRIRAVLGCPSGNWDIEKMSEGANDNTVDLAERKECIKLVIWMNTVKEIVEHIFISRGALVHQFKNAYTKSLHFQKISNYSTHWHIHKKKYLPHWFHDAKLLSGDKRFQHNT